MTDYAVNGPYPAFHYGGHVKGNEYACFCEPQDLRNPSARVLLIPNAPVSVLSSTPLIVRPSFFGKHVNRRSNDRDTGIAVATVRSHDMELGMSRWQKIEPFDDVWDFSALDPWVDWYYSLGYELVFTLFGTPQAFSARPSEVGAYNSGNPGLSAEPDPSKMDRWDRYCAKIAARYKGRIKYYEIWNEPNIDNNGTTLPNPTTRCFFTGTWAKLSEMTRRGAVAIKAIDPAAKIISPPVQGWAATGTDTSGDYLLGMMDAPDGIGGKLKDWVDVVGVHLYTDAAASTLAAMTDRALAARAAAGLSALEIWDTESGLIGGTASMTDAQIATYLTRFMITLAAKGVNRTMYYTQDNTMGFPNRRNVYAHWNNLREDLLLGNVQYASRLFDGRLVYATPARGQVIV